LPRSGGGFKREGREQVRSGAVEDSEVRRGLTLSSCPSGDDDKGKKKRGRRGTGQGGWAALERKERREAGPGRKREPKERERVLFFKMFSPLFVFRKLFCKLV
jgi:hypothetical protein